MEELIKLYISDESHVILIAKFISAFIGANGGYFLHINYFHSIGNIKIEYLPKGFLYSFFGMLGAIFLLGPSTIEHSFVSGVVGMVALTNLFKQNNQGAENKNYIGKELTIEELTETYQQKISN